MKLLTLSYVCCVLCCGVTLALPAEQTRQMRRRLVSRKAVNKPVEPVKDIENERTKRSHDKWLEIIAQFARPGANGAANLPWQPFPIELAVAGGDGGRPVSLPLLVLPIPVPVPGLNQECSATGGLDSRFGGSTSLTSSSLTSSGAKGVTQITETTTNVQVDLETQEQNIDYLIQLFKEQIPRGPKLPPAVVGTPPQIEQPRVIRGYLPPDAAEVPAVPPTPIFDQSMMIRGFLTVSKADYTESYNAWYDSKSGATRVDYHDEGTTCYRMRTADGRIQRFERHIDRTGEEDVRMCGVTAPYKPEPRDLTPPGLPDPREFTFGGYREEYGGQAEVWTRTVRGAPGALGAAPREELTFRHELLIARNDKGFAIPLRYTVAVDSSVLGPNCDGYEHMYSEVKLIQPNPNKFLFNSNQKCDVQEKLDPRSADDMARLDPLREFTLPARDERYDVMFNKFIQEYERTFTNDKEAALRKTLVIKNLRRITSCNRQSLSFTTKANYLLDRLDVEMRVTYGIDFTLTENTIDFVTFPYSNSTISSSATELEDEFDWRKLGGVTSVRNQGSCASCWAHSVVGSVEGAVFRSTGKLQELSEQCLVDCGQSHGAKGCNGSWPSYAFNYIKDKGIPARSVYTPYQAKVLQCKENEVPKAAKIKGYTQIPPNNIAALKLAIRKEAPAVVIVDTDNLLVQFMSKGVYHDERPQRTRKPKLAHAELAVGWGKHRGDTYFILKNSYGEKYAEQGYIRVHAPSNTMYVLAKPSVALV